MNKEELTDSLDTMSSFSVLRLYYDCSIYLTGIWLTLSNWEASSLIPNLQRLEIYGKPRRNCMSHFSLNLTSTWWLLIREPADKNDFIIFTQFITLSKSLYLLLLICCLHCGLSALSSDKYTEGKTAKLAWPWVKQLSSCWMKQKAFAKGLDYMW